MWISEADEHNKLMMKEDLEYLFSLSCTYIYSSEDTNEYIPINN